MWKVRHEGSPKFLEVTFQQVQQGLVDGNWEPTDEVMGPGETEWTAIEAHPRLEELAAEIEPPPSRGYDDQSSLDMTALIDVCLVLLVFFILTTSVAALQVRLEAPGLDEKKKAVNTITLKDAEETMVLCKLSMKEGKLVVEVEKEEVELAKVGFALRKRMSPKKTALMLDHEDEVPHDAVVKVIDAAKAIGMDRVATVVP